MDSKVFSKYSNIKLNNNFTGYDIYYNKNEIKIYTQEGKELDIRNAQVKHNINQFIQDFNDYLTGSMIDGKLTKQEILTFISDLENLISFMKVYSNLL
jgi:hypothetical protein